MSVDDDGWRNRQPARRIEPGFRTETNNYQTGKYLRMHCTSSKSELGRESIGNDSKGLMSGNVSYWSFGRKERLLESALQRFALQAT